ncbi:hypothetical protein MATL_G00174660 [Megalops atlanticus]|uniref:Ig-like domain-containing protein n=1 Tax=Megalops atlanticus TaxID=7932 RepID=A0A9D3PPY3_MEGAT|nr:hypothetical protein MATL_G00174660 [Megalops atlanticus]
MARVLHFTAANILRLWFSTLLFRQLYTARAEGVSQPSQSVRARLGGSVTLECYVSQATYFEFFWVKQTLEEVPVCVAIAQSTASSISYCKGFNNHTRLKVIKSDHAFNLSLSHIQQSDVATYYCGAYLFKNLFFGNGTRVILEDKTNEGSELNKTNDVNMGKSGQPYVFYTVLVLVVTNTASVIVIGVLIYKGKRKLCTGASSLSNMADNMDHQHADTLNYAALSFGHSRSGRVRRDLDPAVLYAGVRAQHD